MLLRTTRLRIAFLSPGAGTRPLSGGGFFFLEAEYVVFSPRFGLGGAVVLPFVGFALRLGLVDKDIFENRKGWGIEDSCGGAVRIQRGLHRQHT